MLSNPITILAFSALFGFTVKMADLLDEHGLRLFKGARILFGFLWGILGSLLLLSNNIMAVFVFAILMQWILRYRIDFLNHGIAASIILITFLYNLPNFTMNWTIFWTIFIPYIIFGLLNDAADRREIKGKLAKISRSYFYLIVFPLILIFIDISYWIVPASSALQILFYELATKQGMKIIANQKTVS